jgi:hypothetical protein
MTRETALKSYFLLRSNKKYPPNQGRIIKIPAADIFCRRLPPVAARSGGEGEGIEIPFFIAEQ